MEKMFYDGTKLLSLKDLNGNTPEIYLCTSNRSAGKTTWFSRYFVKRFIEYGEKFALLYRYNYELDSISDKFFKEINVLFFPDYVMTDKRQASGIFHTLYLQRKNSEDIKECGYAISLNSADQLKKYSHLFSDVQRMLFDEFQSENNHYCNNEIQKFQSVHTTIARGNGKQVRYVPVYMLSNPVTLLNPYYVALGISERLTTNTKYLRGNGFVLENIVNQSAKKQNENSAFLSAFNNDYKTYVTSGGYLSDSSAFIEAEPSNGTYICTIRFNNRDYAIKEYKNQGYIYVSTSIDSTFPRRIAVDLPDHTINYVLLRHYDPLIDIMREFFNSGSVRFKNQTAKSAFLKLISYKMV